jgi:hypothetical protein
MCWYCYWGWPKPVADIYNKYLKKLDSDSDALEFGQSHTVWSDENFDDNCVKSCINECDRPSFDYERDTETTRIVRESLVELLAVPESVRCPPESGHHNEDAAKYPPPAGLEMVKVR